jgi:POT family proton (H+)-dependent oligopeptide transporter
MKVLERRSIRRVPVVLPAVAGIEMWERFSFYGMQAILAY